MPTFNYSGAIQSWTVPSTGTYSIEAYGAQGGNGLKGALGGNGARMKGNFSLTAGEVIKILVGQQPAAGKTANTGGGGGGGSFVVRGTNTALIVAGGGGGGDYRTNAGSAAPVTTSGTVGLQSGGAGGTNGNGGTGIYYCGGGGGLNGNGTGSSETPNNYGRSFTNGGTGGVGSYGPGGFGGGGGVQHGGGGGGGYSGGGAGNSNYPGGGGGSYNVGTSPSNTAGARVGHGQVIITSLTSVPALTTTAASAITANSATVGGNVTDTGGENPTRYIQWGTTTSYGTNINAAAGGTGAYTGAMSGLAPATTYYFRAYATNSAGTTYGTGMSFTTLKGTQSAPTIPVASAINQITATLTSTAGSHIVCNGETKVSGSKWEGLVGGTQYTAYAYMPSNSQYNQSANGPTLTFTTLVKVACAAPTPPNVLKKTAETVVLGSSTPYSMVTFNGESKPSGSIWTGLNTKNAYEAYAYLETTPMSLKSPNSTTLSFNLCNAVIGEVTTDGDFKIGGNINTRLPAITEGLIAHYPFDGTSDPVVVYESELVDTKTNGLDELFVPVDAPTFSSEGVYINGNSTCYLRTKWPCGPEVNFQRDDYLIVEISAKPTEARTGVFCSSTAGYNHAMRYNYSIWYNSDGTIGSKVCGYAKNPTEYQNSGWEIQTTSTKSFGINQYHNIKIEYDKSQLRLYVNGALEATVAALPDVELETGSGTGIFKMYSQKDLLGIQSWAGWFFGADGATTSNASHITKPDNDPNAKVPAWSGKSNFKGYLKNFKLSKVSAPSTSNSILSENGISIETATTNISPRDGLMKLSSGEHIGDVVLSNGTSTTFGGGWRAATHYNNAICRIDFTNTPYGWGKVLRWIHKNTTGWKGITSTVNFNAVAGKTYAISVWVRVSSGLSGNPSAYSFYGPEGYRYHFQWEKPPANNPNEWIRGTSIFTPNIDVSGGVYLYGIDSGHDGLCIDYWGYQIEESTFATSYCDVTKPAGTLNIPTSIGTGNFTIFGEFIPNADSDLLPNGNYFLNLGGGFLLRTYNQVPYIDGNTITGLSGQNVHIDYNTTPRIKTRYIIQREGTKFTWRMKDDNGQDITWTKIHSNVPLIAVSSLSYNSGWGGTHKNLSIYNRALSDNEIKQLISPAFELKPNGDLIINQIKSKPSIPKDAYYFPLGCDSKDEYAMLSSTSESNVSYEQGSIWVGNSMQNLVTNPSFKDSSSWTINTNGSGVFSTSNGYGKISIPQGITGKYHYLSQNIASVTPANTTVTFSVTFKNNTIGRASIRLVMFEGGTAPQQPQSFVSLDGSGIPIRISVSGTHTAISSSMRTDILTGSYYEGITDVDIEFSSVQLEVRPFASAFVEGSRSDSKLAYAPGFNMDSPWTFGVFIKPSILSWRERSRNPILEIGSYYLANEAQITVSNWSANGNDITVIIHDNKVGVATPSGHTLQNTDFDKWIFVCVRFDGSILHLDSFSSSGQRHTQKDKTWTNPIRNNVFVGSYGWVDSLNGSLRDFIMVSRCLSDDELKAIYRDKMSQTNDGTLQLQNSIKTGQVL